MPFFPFLQGQQACRNPVSRVDRCMDSTQIAFKFEKCPTEQTDSRGKYIYIILDLLHRPRLDSRSADYVPKNQNWLFGGMKYSFDSNQFGLLKGNMTRLLISYMLTWHQVLWYPGGDTSFAFCGVTAFISCWLILSRGYNPGLILHFCLYLNAHIYPYSWF